MFILMLSKTSTGRSARVKWRRGNEIGAEFLGVDSSSASQSTADAPRANSSSTSRSTADAPRVLKARGAESQKSEGLTSSFSSRAQAREPHVSKLKADAREFVGSNGGDKARTVAQCQMTDPGEQSNRAVQKKSRRKRIDLSGLQKRLGPKHIALIHALKDVDPESSHGQELASIIESLDEISH
jgi:hypothetical protein